MNQASNVLDRSQNDQLTAGSPTDSAHPPFIPPPPYYLDSDDLDCDHNDCSTNDPIRLVINASNRIQGSNNIVPNSSTLLPEAIRHSAALIQTIARLQSDNRRGRQQQLHVDLTINCGITVVGDRNVIGQVCMKPRGPSPATTATATSTTAATTIAAQALLPVVTAKRKAENANTLENFCLSEKRFRR